jgi:PAS domain S-box-containing protein
MSQPARRSLAAADTSATVPDDLFRVLVDRVEDYAIFALDPDGYIMTWNTGAQRLKFYSPDEAIGMHFSNFYRPEDKAKPAQELAIAIAEGRVEDEGWRVRKDGSLFWANVVITALRDDDGVLIGFAKVTRDLTERRAAEELIRESEERFRLLVQSVRDYAIFMLDPTGHIQTWNAGAEHIKGYSAEEIIGSHFSIFYPTEDIEAGKPERELEIATRTGEYEEEGWRLRKDGTPFWANVVITPVRTAAGKLAGFAKVTRDLTERRAAYERALEAETSNRAKSEFLAAMSHELRTPLNAIGGYTQLMQMGISGPINDEQKTQLARIQRSQEHLLGIINDILNFSRMEAGQVKYDVAAIPVHEVIHAVAPMITIQAAATGVDLVIGSCAPDTIAIGDRAKLEQILLNLLSNAVKFTPEGGRIDVGCDVKDGMVLLTVRDTGIGIAPDQIESIFAPFVQVGRTLSTPKEGTGLGLAISRDLARAMNGDLTVSSELGVGSTFTLSMPRQT